MNGALKMVSSVGCLSPQPLSHESTALTTRPQLLAFQKTFKKNIKS
jgi:hypothetical protein